MRVYVTGIGIISAIGNNVDECRESLRSGKSGISSSQYFETKFAESFPFGEIPHSTEDLKARTGLTDTTGMTRTDYIAFIAFEQALQSAGLTSDQVQDFRTGFMSASTVGGMCLTDKAYEDTNKLVETSEFCEAYSNGRHMLHIARHYGLHGPSDCINTACSSSANTIAMGARMIQAGRIDRAIAGGVDSLSKYTANGFNALQILSSESCKPFDVDRVGLNLGEAAAFLILESEEVVGDKPVLAELTGWGNTTDAYHPSSLSDEAFGPASAIKTALDLSGIKGEDIDYVNAHGTATPNNDQAELTGVKTALGTLPPISSTKSFTGHTLGAAGGVEAVFSVMAIQNNELYPSLNCSNPMPETNGQLVNETISDKEVNHVLSNSFGFAGNCSSLIFSKV